MASIIPTATGHPYYPVDVEIADYLANEWSVPVLLGAFSSACTTVLIVASLIANRVRPNLALCEMSAVWWFVLSGCIHTVFEGYFALNHSRMGPAQDLFGQLWKEYALSDSRYLTSDSFVLCIESATALIWGPLCFVVAGLITVSHPLRHPLQIVVSVGQIYGLILYYAISTFDLYYRHISYSRPEFLYFWVYYLFMNLIWMIFPSILLYSSVSTIAKAFKALDRMDTALKSNRATESEKKTL